MTSPATASASSPEPAVSSAKNPWKSLHFYTEQDRDIFFGRKSETDEVVRLVQRDQLTIVFGRSGLGKTSLLRAGVIPRLREEGFLPVIKRVVYLPSASAPTRQIREEVFKAATSAGIDIEEAGQPTIYCNSEEREETLWELFHRYRFWGPRNDVVIPVLILDQFEEVFTNGLQSPHSEEFLSQLGDLVENRMPPSISKCSEETGERLSFDARAQNYRVILSLREDFVPKLDSLRPRIPSVMRNRFALAPLGRQQGIDVVNRAGSQWVNETVAREIVAVVAGEAAASEQETSALAPGAEIEPAYLSVMCYELFERMKETGRTKIDSDLVSAEQLNILDNMYERSFLGVDPRTRIFVEDRLLTPAGFRGTVPLADAKRENVPPADLESLVDRRILRHEERLGTTHIELSHDLLTSIVKKSRDAREAVAQQEAERRREEELKTQLRRTRLHALAAVSAVILLAGGILFYLFGWVIPSHSYSRNFTKRWGVIHPVGPLPKSAVAHRPWTLKLTRKGWFGDVQSVEVIDANQKPTPNHPIKTYLAEWDTTETQEKPSRYEFVYDRNGEVVYEVAWDRFNRKTWTFVHVPCEQQGKKTTKGFFVDSSGYPRPQGRSRAEFVEIMYDSRGFEAYRFYRNRRGSPTPGPDNAYGVRISYDDKGREIRETSLDERGVPMNDAVGNASMGLKYDADGNIIEEYAFDAKGKPTLLNKSNWHAMKLVYDRWGREVERRYYDLSHKPVVETEDYGAHKITSDYDDRGNMKSIKLFDAAEQPVDAEPEFFPFPAHEKRMTYDAQNRLQTLSYFSTRGKPVTGPEGWHGQKDEYDSYGFLRVVSTFDVTNAPVTTREGFCRREWVNDGFGRPIEERFFDAARRAVANAEGYHLRRNVYDSAGNLVKEAYFDAGNRPVVDRTNGIHCIESTFDLFRHCKTRQFSDASGKPVNSRQHFHRVEYEYDRFGSLTVTRWFDKDGKPCNGPEGVHCVKMSYDNRGLLKQEARYDINNQPVADKNGIYESLYEYNDKRQQTKWEYFGLNRKPAEDKDGDHLCKKEYDERGREIKATQLRADGTSNWDRALGIATRTQVYDRENRWIEQAYYDAKNRLVTGPHGFAKGSIVYHPDGREDSLHYGPSGKLTFNPLFGFAMKKDESRQGEFRESYYGPNGKLITGPSGFAEMRGRRDGKGNPLSAAWFGPAGKPVSGPWGVHRAERAPDGRTYRYFDTENREIPFPRPDTVVPVIFIREIIDIKQPAARIGLYAGDILWRYGNWSFATALAAERAKRTTGDKILEAVAQAFLNERDRRSGGKVAMTVLRNGHAIKLLVPPLPGKTLGMRFSDRRVPVATFEKWKSSVR